MVNTDPRESLFSSSRNKIKKTTHKGGKKLRVRLVRNFWRECFKFCVWFNFYEENGEKNPPKRRSYEHKNGFKRLQNNCEKNVK